MRSMRDDRAGRSVFLTAALGAAALGGPAAGQVQVGDGQRLTETDLRAGMFAGQAFTLGAGTVFQINDGGVIGPLGDGFPIESFDFRGSSVRLNRGGSLALDARQQTHLGAARNLRLRMADGALLGVPPEDDSGSVGGSLVEFAQSEVEILGGRVLGMFSLDGASAAIRGGALERGVTLRNGSEVTMEGGRVRAGISVGFGSSLTLSGGGLGGALSVAADSEATFVGGEFLRNGAPVQSLAEGLSGEGVLTGTLSDGSVFILTAGKGDWIAPGAATLERVDLAPADMTPMVVDSGEGPSGGLRPGQSLTLAGEGRLGAGFTAASARVDVQGGEVEDGMQTAFSEVRISGGRVGNNFAAYAGSEVRISGGAVGDGFLAGAGSRVDITGGTIGVGMTTAAGSEARIFGGEIGPGFVASMDSVVRLFVTEASIDGDPLRIAPGETILITQRGGALLEAMLADGSFFDLTLHDGVFEHGTDHVSVEATLTATFVPTPGGAALFVMAGGALFRRRRG